MSILSKWLDEHVTHSTERRKAAEKADAATAAFEKQKADVKAEHDRIDNEKKFEKDRRDRKTIRRLKGGMRKSGFLDDSAPSETEKLG